MTAETVRGKLAMHNPCGEIDSIAAKVEERAAAVLFWVGEPVEELGTDSDLFGAVVAVVNDDFAQVGRSCRG